MHDLPKWGSCHRMDLRSRQFTNQLAQRCSRMHDATNDEIGAGASGPDIPPGPRPKVPGNASILLWGAFGCLVVALLLSVIIGAAGYLIYTAARHFPERAQGPRPIAAQNGPGDGGAFPPASLHLGAPREPSSPSDEIDLRRIAPPHLTQHAFQLYQAGRYSEAVQWQYRYVATTGAGQYNLACFYARSGDVDAALYWLQIAARKELACPEWSSHDSDLVNVRGDDRWAVMLNDLQACARRWEEMAPGEVMPVLPRDNRRDRRLPVIVALPAATDGAHSIVGSEMFQSLADQMQVAFLGVSGTLGRGRGAYAWSEDPARDLAQVEGALQSQSGNITPAEGQIILFGLAQGAVVAAELAARRPDRFAGAILVSPQPLIRTFPPDFDDLADDKHPTNPRPGIVAVSSADDEADIQETTRAYAQAFEKLGARVHLVTDLRKTSPTLVPACREFFPEWCEFIRKPTPRASSRREPDGAAARASPEEGRSR